MSDTPERIGTCNSTFSCNCFTKPWPLEARSDLQWN